MTNWIGDSGNTSNTGEWDAGVPDSTHDAIFNAGSFSTTGLTVTVDAALSCKDLSFVGATNSPTLAHSAILSIYGSYTGIAAMTHSGTSVMLFCGTSSGLTVTAGTTLSCGVIFSGLNGGWTLQDALNVGTKSITMRRSSLNTGNQTITCGTFGRDVSDPALTLTLGSSVINCSTWDWSGTVTGLIIPANTCTINDSGNFSGGSIATYHIVNLTGATSTISGNNTFNTLALPKGTTQTITITDGSTQSAKTFTLSGDAKHTHTITGTATAGYTLTATGGGTVYMDYVNMSYCTATGATFLYGPHCTMTSCTGWKPAPRYSYFSGGRI